MKNMVLWYLLVGCKSYCFKRVPMSERFCSFFPLCLLKPNFFHLLEVSDLQWYVIDGSHLGLNMVKAVLILNRQDG